jgi:hypothetical protein
VLDINDLNLKELQEEIEQMRLNLMDIVAKKGSLSTDAIRVSQALNKKIKEYCLLMNIYQT